MWSDEGLVEKLSGRMWTRAGGAGLPVSMCLSLSLSLPLSLSLSLSLCVCVCAVIADTMGVNMSEESECVR